VNVIIQMLKSITCIFFVFLFVAPSIAQNISTNKIGDFEFKASDKMGWKASPDAKLQAENILKYEGVKLTPSFAFVHSSSGLVYGTLKILRDGLAFSAEQLASSVPQFPEAWGIKNNVVQNTSGRTDSGLDFAVMRVSGPGDGKFFGRGKPYKTLGVWIDIPVQYQDINGYHSILISLFYRSFDSKKPSDENFLKSVMNSISPVAGASIITEKKYKEYFQPIQTENNAASKIEPQKSVQAEIIVNSKIEPQKSVEVEIGADSKSDPQKLVQAEKSENNKIEPLKFNFSQKSKDSEVSDNRIPAMARQFNLATRPEGWQQSNAMANTFGCESLEVINVEDADLWLHLPIVQVANIKRLQKCVETLVSRLSGAVNSVPANK